MNAPTRRMARNRIRSQQQAYRMAVAAGEDATRPCLIAKRQIESTVAVLMANDGLPTATFQRRLRGILDHALAESADSIRDSLEDAAAFGWQSGVDSWLGSVPAEWWVAWARRKRGMPVREEAEYTRPRGETALQEMMFRWASNAWDKLWSKLTIKQTIDDAIDWLARITGFTDDPEPEPKKSKKLTPADRFADPPTAVPQPEPHVVPRQKVADKVKAACFNAPTREQAEAILRSDRWPDRLTWPQRLQREGFSFDAIVNQVSTSVSQGKTLKEITKDVLPLVDNIGYRARRIARTESMRVMQTMQRESDSRIEEMIYGRQIKSVGDERVRPEHAERSGRIYYKIGYGPPGSPRYEECPETPDAPNCRCTSYPLLIGINTEGLEDFPKAPHPEPAGMRNQGALP